MPEYDRISAGFHYAKGELEALRDYASKECLDDMVTRIERIIYTMSRLAQEPNRNHPVLPFPGPRMVLDPEEETGGAA